MTTATKSTTATENNAISFFNYTHPNLEEGAIGEPTSLYKVLRETDRGEGGLQPLAHLCDLDHALNQLWCPYKHRIEVSTEFLLDCLR